jgi:hypothetical protein
MRFAGPGRTSTKKSGPDKPGRNAEEGNEMPLARAGERGDHRLRRANPPP